MADPLVYLEQYQTVNQRVIQKICSLTKLVNAPIIFPDVSVPEFSEKDLDSLMMELPPLEIPESEDKTIFESTPNTSLSLGSLQMLNNYGIEYIDNQLKH
ncbi:hypothetical protein Btru_074851 [Bulinus truncatus]|nr:hypothetical protein Btru_074851 [Bulinus truncatus]